MPICRYQDGVEKEVYKGDRGYVQIAKYIEDHVKQTPKTEVVEEKVEEKAEEKVEAQIPISPVIRSNANPRGEVLVLNKELFTSASNDGPLFIKYYAPWCVSSVHCLTWGLLMS